MTLRRRARERRTLGIGGMGLPRVPAERAEKRTIKHRERAASLVAAAGVAAGLVLPAGLLLAAPAEARARLGGYTLEAQADPVSVLLYDPVIPVPAEPQLEARLSYTHAMMDTGTGRAVASALWPGSAVGEGLPQLAGNPDAKYPVQTSAASPGGPKDGKQQPGMRAHADDKTVEAQTGFSVSGGSGSSTMPADLPSMPLLAEPTGFAARSRDAVSSSEASSAAETSSSMVSLLGGLVKFYGLHVVSQATTDGDAGRATGRVTYTGVSVLGRELAVDHDSVRTPTGSPVSYPQPPAGLSSALAPLGITLGLPKVDKKLHGAEARVASHGPVLTVHTKVLRQKLDPVTAALQNALPGQLRDQLDPVLRLAPKIVIVLGDTSADANAAPQADLPSGLGTGGPVSGGTPPGMPHSGATPDSGSSSGGNVRLPVVAGRPASSAGFAGLPPGVLVAGLAIAAVASWGLRRMSGLLFASEVCEHGQISGVPDLREMWSYVER
jgi:hypothetical protein